jgi:tetratricopeptide (TPR) repeat protein
LAAQKASALAFLYYKSGRREDARAWAHESVGLNASPQIVMQATSILARLGLAADAERTAKLMPAGEGPFHEATKSRMEGEQLAGQGKLDAAIKLLKDAARLDAAFKPKEYLAHALALAGRHAEARIQYNEINDKGWLVWGSPESEWPGLRLASQRYLESH